MEYAKCFGIQPIIVEPDGSVECNLFNLYRKYKPRRREHYRVVRDFTLKESDVKIDYHHKTDEEKQQIVKNAINYYQLPYYCVKMMQKYARYDRVCMNVDDLIWMGHKDVNNLIMRFALREFIRNKVVSGNRFLSSNKGLLDSLNPNTTVVGIYEKILLPENWAPKNEIIVVANGGMTFDNGILLCPLLYRQELNKWLVDNNKSDDFGWMKADRFPIMREYRHKYDVYAEFMNECIPLEWHFEVFEKNVANFYSRIVFNKQDVYYYDE